MSPDECRDKLRFSLDDKTGQLRFTAFEIVDPLGCEDSARELTRYLVGRRLADADPAHIRGLACASHGECRNTIANVIEEYQAMFLRRAGESSVREV